MAQRGRLAWVRGAVATVSLVAAVVVLGVPAYATLKYGQVEFSGSFATQNLVRVGDIDELMYVQNRNTAYLRMDYEWFKNGKLVELLEIPFIKQSKFFLLYRGVYDGVYDLGPGGDQRGVHKFDDRIGGPIEGNAIGTIRQGCDPDAAAAAGNPSACLRQGGYSSLEGGRREDIKRENKLREVYVDFSLRDIPVSFRIGRQQVIWGESDQFRMMDIWNPLNLRWHLQQEPFTEIREPLWMLKGLWDMPVVELPWLGVMSNSFLEVVWNPFDYKPGVIVDFLPRPWAVPFNNPLRPGQVQIVGEGIAGLVTPNFTNLRGTFDEGTFENNPWEASAIGARLHSVTEQGFEFTLNYVYHRGRGIGAAASNAFAVDIDRVDVDLANPANLTRTNGEIDLFEGVPIFEADVQGEIKHDYNHIFGFTANYFEGDYTQTVFRLETAYDMNVPYICSELTRDAEGIPTVDRIEGTNVFSACRPGIDSRSAEITRFAPGTTRRDVWAGMIGFDRPTWIRPLNRKTTWFLTGQFFFSYITGPTADLRGSVLTASRAPYFSPSDPAIFPDSLINNAGFGRWGKGKFAGITERVQNSSFEGVNEDNVKKWEMLVTLAAFSFYRGGSVMPFVAMAIDPRNQSVLMAPFINYFWTNNFILRLGAKSYFGFGGGDGSHLDPWGAGGLNARRDEIEFRATVQF
jgi:hypothetical protein